jgi:hypothetical protein
LPVTSFISLSHHRVQVVVIKQSKDRPFVGFVVQQTLPVVIARGVS